MILDSFTTPPGFLLTHLIRLDPEWQANLCDGEHVAIGTGNSPEEAIASAGQNAEEGKFAGRLFSLDRLAGATSNVPSDLLAMLGLTHPAPDFKKRRFTP